MVYGVVYLILNLVNGMKYVGQTTQSLKTRFRQHANRKKSLLGQAMRIDGRKNFIIKVLEECATQEELNAREIAWIMRCNCIFPYGYNLTKGGAHRHTGVYVKRSSKPNTPKEKKFHTNRKWDAYPVLEGELQKREIHGAQLAEVLHIRENRVAAKMAGKKGITIEQMTAIRDFLGVDMSIEELFRRNPDVQFPGPAPCIRHWDTFPTLEAELKRQGIKCAQLAELLDISANSVSRRMQGIYDFTPAQMTTIRDFLGVTMSVAELFRRADGSFSILTPKPYVVPKLNPKLYVYPVLAVELHRQKISFTRGCW